MNTFVSNHFQAFKNLPSSWLQKRLKFVAPLTSKKLTQVRTRLASKTLRDGLVNTLKPIQSLMVMVSYLNQGIFFLVSFVLTWRKSTLQISAVMLLATFM